MVPSAGSARPQLKRGLMSSARISRIFWSMMVSLASSASPPPRPSPPSGRGSLALQAGRHLLVLADELHAAGERHGLHQRREITGEIFLGIRSQGGDTEMSLQHL